MGENKDEEGDTEMNEGEPRVADEDMDVNEVTTINQISALNLNEVNVLSRKVRNEKLMVIRRKDYTMLIGTMKVIEEVLKGAIESPEEREVQREKIEKFIKKGIEAQDMNGQYYLIEVAWVVKFKRGVKF